MFHTWVGCVTDLHIIGRMMKKTIILPINILP